MNLARINTTFSGYEMDADVNFVSTERLTIGISPAFGTIESDQRLSFKKAAGGEKKEFFGQIDFVKNGNYWDVSIPNLLYRNRNGGIVPAKEKDIEALKKGIVVCPDIDPENILLEGVTEEFIAEQKRKELEKSLSALASEIKNLQEDERETQEKIDALLEEKSRVQGLISQKQNNLETVRAAIA